MPKTKITIAVDSEKIHAISQFATENSPTVEDELTTAVDKLYQKTVPTAVRQYIDNMPTAKSRTKSKPV